MDAFAAFERALINECQRADITLAKQRGAYQGCKQALSAVQAAELRRRVAAGEQKAALARVWHQPRDTLSLPKASTMIKSLYLL
jgi:DNA invertase Pin-like site-specific DNA recombinase